MRTNEFEEVTPLEVRDPKLLLRITKVGNLGIDYRVISQPEELRNKDPKKSLSFSYGNYVVCSSDEPGIAVLLGGGMQRQESIADSLKPVPITLYLRGHVTKRDNAVTKLSFKSKRIRDWVYAQIEMALRLFEMHGYFGEE